MIAKDYAEFQSTHPRGVRRPITEIILITYDKFQSTHPRGVRLIDSGYITAMVRISIHAPTWGATQDTIGLNFNPRFQSTHPRGVRLLAMVYQLVNEIFQSTHPRGVRPGASITLHDSGKISIHAPTWGATMILSFASCYLTDFNPRTHVGCDLSMLGELLSENDFNPRTHVGCDLSTAWKFFRESLFQSTHPRGVRPNCKLACGG